MQRANSLQGVLGSTFTQPKIDVPSPPNTAPVDYDTFDMLNSQDSDFESSEFQYLPESKSIKSLSTHGVQKPSQSPPESGSFQSSPELADMPLPTDTAGQNPKVPICPSTPSRSSAQNAASFTPGSSPSKAKLSPRAPTIDSLNLDARVQASIAETGVSLDEIAGFISGPDPEDGKWVCLHTGCNRRFGRKENIKSHIQTHLGDRQFKCDHCEKCFVRGHDLKRHAKIHTGDKPYECLCGNVFARHDALTRHRQRGMCIGGYKGVIRKTTKRGRPRKSRPDMEERHDKALRTREKAFARSAASPISAYDSSSASPPSEDFENMSIRASRSSSPANDMATFENDVYSMASDVFAFTPPASPGYSTGHKPSPAASYHSYSSFDAGSMSRTSSKQSLEQIPEELADLPPISEAAGCFDPEPRTISSSVVALSSPPTVPALTASSIGSDYDIFLNQDHMAAFDKNEFSSLNDSPFSDFGADSGLTNDMDLFGGKLPGHSSTDEVFLEFTEDQQQSEIFFQ
jgi:regulatory protein SWI5